MNINAEEALQDSETRGIFVEHLQDLRDVTDRVLEAMEDWLTRFPFGIRFAARVIHDALQSTFQNELDTTYWKAVGHFVWNRYLNGPFTEPTTYGIIDNNLAPRQKRNLAMVATVLHRISTAGEFTKDDRYLQPLNEYMSQAVDRMMNFLEACKSYSAKTTNWTVIAVPDAEEYFDMHEYEDLASTSKPILYISTGEIYFIHSLLARELESIVY